jgi:putative solute:sodium symporter small subunit
MGAQSAQFIRAWRARRFPSLRGRDTVPHPRSNISSIHSNAARQAQYTKRQGAPSMTQENQAAYWKQNLTYIVILLAIWFAVSYVAGIMIANQLDAYRIGGFPLGFWFANQGSLVTFVILIFVYVALMNRLDKKFGVYET